MVGGRTEQFFFAFGKRITLLVSICNIEDKLDDRNDERAERKQLCVCNHLTTPFAGEGFRPP